MLLDLAIEFAKSTGALIGRNLIITDENGIVIGSDDPSRLSTLHEASLEVIKTGQPRSHDEVEAGRMIGVKPGITLPIELSGKVIGTLGIPGDPEEVTAWGRLVKQQLEIFLREKAYMQSAFIKERTLQSLLQEVAEFDFGRSDPFLLKKKMTELGFDLEVPRLVMLVDLYHFGEVTDRIKKQSSGGLMEEAEMRIQAVKMQVLSTIREIFNSYSDLSLFWGEDKSVILSQLSPTTDDEAALTRGAEKCLELQENLFRQGVKICIGMSGIARDIPQLGQAFRDAQSALRIGKSMRHGPGVYRIDDFLTEDYLLSADEGRRRRFLGAALEPLRGRKDMKDLCDTIRCWCETGFSLSRAGKCLKVHRNTLLYRLEKVRKITGVDPEDFRSLLPLYLAAITTPMEDQAG